MILSLIVNPVVICKQSQQFQNVNMYIHKDYKKTKSTLFNLFHN
jgi:hypothetical protein